HGRGQFGRLGGRGLERLLGLRTGIAYRAPCHAASCRPQFITAPDILMIGAHLASSALMKAAVSFGPRPSVGSTPASCRRWNTAGSSSAVLIAAASLSTTGCGVPGGARIAFQV